MTETRARDGELFGAGAIARLLASHVDDSPERLMSRLAEALDRHRDGVAQRDDVTVLLIEFGCSSSQPNRP